jgi:hypothetical protein
MYACFLPLQRLLHSSLFQSAFIAADLLLLREATPIPHLFETSIYGETLARTCDSRALSTRESGWGIHCAVAKARMGQLEPALDSDRGKDDNELLAIFAMLNRALLPATGAHRSRHGLQYDNPSGDSFPRVLKCHVAPREWEMETLLQAAFQQDGSQIKGEVIVPVEVRGALRHLAGERFRPDSRNSN